VASAWPRRGGWRRQMDKHEVTPSRAARDPEAARRLWQISEAQVRLSAVAR